jgi:hypothetical protein
MKPQLFPIIGAVLLIIIRWIERNKNPRHDHRRPN